MSNPDCPACQERRMHTAEEFALYHPPEPKSEAV